MKKNNSRFYVLLIVSFPLIFLVGGTFFLKDKADVFWVIFTTVGIVFAAIVPGLASLLKCPVCEKYLDQNDSWSVLSEGKCRYCGNKEEASRKKDLNKRGQNNTDSVEGG